MVRKHYGCMAINIRSNNFWPGCTNCTGLIQWWMLGRRLHIGFLLCVINSHAFRMWHYILQTLHSCYGHIEDVLCDFLELLEQLSKNLRVSVIKNTTVLNTTLISRTSTPKLKLKDTGIPHWQYLCSCWWSGLPTVCWNSHRYDLCPFVSGPDFRWPGRLSGELLSLPLCRRQSRRHTSRKKLLIWAISFEPSGILFWHFLYGYFMKKPFIWYQNFWFSDLDLGLWPSFGNVDNKGSHFTASYVVYWQILWYSYEAEFTREEKNVLL
jgi:hypothetical protein